MREGFTLDLFKRYGTKTPIFLQPPPAVPRPKSHEVLRQTGFETVFTGPLAQVAVRSPKQKAPRGAGPEAASRPAEQV